MRFQAHSPSPAHLRRASNIAPPCGHQNAGRGRVACGSGTVRPEARKGPVRDNSPIPPWPTTGRFRLRDRPPRSPQRPGEGPPLAHHGGRRAGSRTRRVRSPPGPSDARETGCGARGVRTRRGREAPRDPPGSSGGGGGGGCGGGQVDPGAQRRPVAASRIRPARIVGPAKDSRRGVSGLTLSPPAPRQPPPVPPGRTFRRRLRLPRPPVQHPPHPLPYRFDLLALTRPTPPRPPLVRPLLSASRGRSAPDRAAAQGSPPRPAPSGRHPDFSHVRKVMQERGQAARHDGRQAATRRARAGMLAPAAHPGARS
jgi:hypothetical protein